MRLTIGPGDDIAALIRAASGESIVAVISKHGDAIVLAQRRATIGPLAMERAPSVRVNAVFVAPGAEPAAVDAAVAFLDQARSTTGQILDLA